MPKDRLRVLAWQVLIPGVGAGRLQYLTGIKAVSRTPGLYWIDPFFSAAVRDRGAFVYLDVSPGAAHHLQMALSTVQSHRVGFLAASPRFVAGCARAHADRLPACSALHRGLQTRCRASVLVPLISDIFGVRLLAKIVLAWSIGSFIVFSQHLPGLAARPTPTSSTSARFLAPPSANHDQA